MKLKIGIDSPKKFDVEDLLNFLAKELNISEDAELMVVYNDNLLDRLSTGDIDYKALLQNVVPNHYTLYIKEDVSGLQYILCHEMVHLSQYDRGDLKMSSDFRTVIWKGETFDNTSEYIDREWEEEAFGLQNKLWRKFKKSKNEDKCR